MNNPKDKEKIFTGIYDSYKDKIYRICYGYIYEKEQVDDLFQEIMINVWNSLDRFRGESKLGTWVYKVAVNTALLYNKKTKFYTRINLTVNDISTNIPAIETDDYKSKEEKLQLLAHSISQLEKNDRLIIALILENLTYEQVSEIVGITPNNVGVKVNRIKKKLLTRINQQNHE
jgi:RNA polymerase sigma-70 factor, ECF subfamily